MDDERKDRIGEIGLIGDDPRPGMDGMVSLPVAPRPGSISGHARLTALIVACALFMENLDGTVIATALPVMASAFGSDPVRMNVALTAYLLSLAVFIPASGWVADRFGTRDVFRIAIGVFTLGSVICGRADGLGFLVAARILQGAGGAMMVPVGRLLLLRSCERRELVRATTWLTIPALLGPVIGPPVGGLITTYLSWRWIFDMNLPIGLLGIALVTRFVEDVREPAPARFDLSGLGLTTLCIVGLMTGLETIGRGLLPRGAVLALFAVAAGSGLAYAVHARSRVSPLLDFRLMRLPTFSVSVYAGSAFRIGVGAMPFLLPLMLQVGFGDSAARSGAITFIAAGGAIAMKPLTPWFLRVGGFRRVLFWNGIVGAGAIALCGAFRPAWPVAAIYAVLFVSGAGRSLQFTAFNSIAYAEVSRARMSAATSLYAVIQQVTLTMGVTAGAGVLQAAMALNGHAIPLVPDFGLAFLAVGAVSVFAVPLALLLPRDAGRDMTD